MRNSYEYCKEQLSLMIKRSKTKIIFPVITFGLIKDFDKNQQVIFTDSEIKKSYIRSVNEIKKTLGHEFHVGGKYYDAYPSRNLPKYGVLRVVENKIYELTKPYRDNAHLLLKDIPVLVNEHISKKLGDIPLLVTPAYRLKIATDQGSFKEMLNNQVDLSPDNFEIFSFAILKVHLEKFACKIYRDTRTSAHDKGVDLSTNFGVIYQIKKLKLINRSSANNIFDEIKHNFSEDRIQDGNVILVIDDISKDIKSYLIDMKIQTISKQELLKLADLLELEDRMKILKVVYDEFTREYKSDI